MTAICLTKRRYGFAGGAALVVLFLSATVVPAVALNLLSINPAQRSPFFQYSLPIVPFVFMAAILALAI